MVQFFKPDIPLSDDEWRQLTPSVQAQIIKLCRASVARAEEPAEDPAVKAAIKATAPPDTPLNVLEEMMVGRFLDDVGWNVALRNDARLARAVAEGEELDAIYTLEDVAALDDFFGFLQLQGFVTYFEQLADRMRVLRVNVPPLRYIWLYFIKVVLGIPGIAAMSPLLLRDEAVMRLVGFNAHEIAHGTTRRGDNRRSPGTPREGPVSSASVANNVVKFHWVALAAMVNQVIQCCVELLVKEKVVDVVIDTSLYETGPECAGAGKTYRERPVQGKSTQARKTKVEVVIHGFKVGVAYHARLGLPLAVTIAPIQTSDVHYVEMLVNDVVKNLGSRKLGTVTYDAGFIDGAAQHRLKTQRGIDFVVRARTDMHVYQDAVALARAAGRPGAEEMKKATRTAKKGQTVVVGVKGLNSWDSYAPPDSKGQENRKDYEPDAVNAVVVLVWEGHRFKEPLVFLTSHDVSRPFEVFDRYDDRSLIENGVFRESKQDWSLERPPHNSEDGVNAHVYLTLAAMALVRTYRMLTETVEATSPLVAEPVTSHTPAPPAVTSSLPDLQLPRRLRLGMLRYRRELKVKNRNKVILFLGATYGILHIQEMAMLSGLRLRDRSPGVGTREQTLRKYGLSP